MIGTVGIISRPRKWEICAVVPPLLEWMRVRKVEVLIDHETADCCGPAGKAVSREELPSRVDLLIVFGGDGTLLAVARLLGEHQIPILPVNLGGLGFLTSVTLDELYLLLEQVLRSQHGISERMALQAEVCRGGKVVERQRALNDAVVSQAALARIMEFDVSVDGNYVARYRADGLIVSTPTGSTAYSLSAGGPILHPDAQAFVITPICPHMLTNRPLVLPDTACVEINFNRGEEPVHLTLDGQVGFELQPADHVVIGKSRSKVLLVRPPTKTYFEILRSKLRWGER